MMHDVTGRLIAVIRFHWLSATAIINHSETIHYLKHEIADANVAKEARTIGNVWIDWVIRQNRIPAAAGLALPYE